MQNLEGKAVETLRSTEGFFKTDMVYLAKGGFWLSLGHIFAALIGFTASLVFAHFFTKEGFGIYKYILSVAGIIGSLSLTGIGQAVTRSVARGFEPLQESAKLHFKWSLGILIAGFVVSGYYFINDNFLLSYSFAIVGLIVPVTSSVALYSSYLLGKKDFRRNSLYGTISNLTISTCIILAVVLSQNVAIIVTVYFLSGAIIATILYRKTLAAYRPIAKEDPTILSFSQHLSFMELIARTAAQLDKILIFHFLGAAPLAIYAFAVSPVEQLQAGKKIFSNLAVPKIASRPFEELQRTAPKKALLALGYSLVLIVIWVLAAPYFYKIFFPQYVDSILYSQVYSLTLIAIAGTIFNEMLVAHKKIKELYIHRITIPILKMVLFFILLPIYGAMGMVFTHIIVITTSILLALYFIKRPFKTAVL